MEKLVVIGEIRGDSSVNLQPFYRTITNYNSSSGDLGEYSLQLLDDQGRLLIEHRFDAQAISHDEAGALSFSEFVPWHVSTKRILLKRKEMVLAERTASPHAPTVRILSPNGGEVLGTKTNITWEASDPDGDPLSYTVLYHDGGKDSLWLPVATGVTTTAITVDTSLWPGSLQGRVMVRVTDGVNTAEDVTDNPFTVSQKSPLVAIIRAQTEEQDHLVGMAYDPEDGLLPAASLVWTSDRDGVIEQGDKIMLKKLSSGTHILTLTVTDSQGQKTVAQEKYLIRDGEFKKLDIK